MQFINVPLKLPVPGHGDTYKNISVGVPTNQGGMQIGGGSLFGQIQGNVLNPVGTNVYNPEKFGIGVGPLPDITAVNRDILGINPANSNVSHPSIPMRTGVAPI